mmetsp:Transcript_120627/g.212797  ORF Transcript_120627/g.212797 Transcript_120627/m.212797 type:complete len:120 (-) Transcript_120627:17-376(-)
MRLSSIVNSGSETSTRGIVTYNLSDFCPHLTTGDFTLVTVKTWARHESHSSPWWAKPRGRAEACLLGRHGDVAHVTLADGEDTSADATVGGRAASALRLRCAIVAMRSHCSRSGAANLP